jgi:hypothetical protein
MRVAQLESESRREKEVRFIPPRSLRRAPVNNNALQERLADRADTSGLLKVCHTRAFILHVPVAHQISLGHQSVCSGGRSSNRQQRVDCTPHCFYH